MAITNEQEKQLEELFKVKLKEQYNKGLQVGVLSVSKVVLDKLNDKSKPFMRRIEDVKHFCEMPWKKQNQIEQALKEMPAIDEQLAEVSDAKILLDENSSEGTSK